MKNVAHSRVLLLQLNILCYVSQQQIKGGVGVAGAVGFKVRRRRDALCLCITVWEGTAY